MYKELLKFNNILQLKKEYRVWIEKTEMGQYTHQTSEKCKFNQQGMNRMTTVLFKC